MGAVWMCVRMRVFQTRNVPSAFNESQWVGASVYLLCFFLLLGLPLQVLVGRHPDSLAVLNGLGMGVAALSLAGLLFGSKVWNIATGGSAGAAGGAGGAGATREATVATAVAEPRGGRGGATAAAAAGSDGGSSSIQLQVKSIGRGTAAAGTGAFAGTGTGAGAGAYAAPPSLITVGPSARRPPAPASVPVQTRFPSPMAPATPSAPASPAPAVSLRLEVGAIDAQTGESVQLPGSTVDTLAM